MRWSAARYVTFEAERTRPVYDLLATVPLDTAAYVIDAGCGPGNSTEALIARFPGASILAFDSSAEMCAEARRRLPSARVEQWRVEAWVNTGGGVDLRRPDVILSNAVLQWVPDHAVLLPKLVDRLAPGGVLALQVPDNLAEQSHVFMEEIAAEPEWARLLRFATAARTRIEPAEYYVRLLRPRCSDVFVWRTTYYHELRGGIADVVEWMRGTGLRPFLDPLDEEGRSRFLKAYHRKLETAYAPLDNGSVLFAMPRLFVVAVAANR
ncbi:MAG: methyltransferase domain-containing protein [Acidimicrobiia bacterium]|nr:methyltransferase domain-containing protein [Acidimicrobiia bacterium]